VCTLTAIIVPDVLLHGGVGFDWSAASPRLIGVAASALWLCFSRHIVGCLATGMAAYTLARLYPWT
jgi:branched-subunit amino acid transport protein